MSLKKLKIGDIVIYKPSNNMEGQHGGPGYIDHGSEDKIHTGRKIRIIEVRYNDNRIIGKFIFGKDSYRSWAFVPTCLSKSNDKDQYIAYNVKNIPNQKEDI